MKTIALVLFVLMYVMMIARPKYRPYYALIAASIFIMIGIIPLPRLVSAINWNVLLMISGTMIIVHYFIASQMPGRLADIILENISKRDIALCVKTARHYRTVAENSEMVAKSVAEYALAEVVSSHIRPIEALAVLKVKLIANTRSPRSQAPRISEAFVEQRERSRVSFVYFRAFSFFVEVPESQHGQHSRA